ncbi:MAG TPA: TIGR03619 family F420-dependent LLM class oxidoreductase [Acidimicrobiales bacterium]|nr:TIGR03619 family F420-dependent LLM class oxidoreductase [Acidimicrobiales bacterium]
MVRPTLSLTLPTFGSSVPADQWHRLLDLARVVDEAGVDRVLLTDHVVMGGHLDRYPFGEFHFQPDVPWLEPLSTIAAIAAVTRRVRMSTKILIAPLRPAPVLAKTLATIDQLSQGRVEIGVATGWQREEYDASGIDWSQRGQLLTDTLAACRALWASSPATFRSASFSFDDIWCEPKPVQDRLPIWIAGGPHRRNLDRLVRLGDGWIPPAYAAVDSFIHDATIVRDAWLRAGREGALQIQGDLDVVLGANERPDIAASLAAGVPHLLAAGATTVNVVLPLFVGRLERAPAFLDELVTRWHGLTGDGNPTPAPG